MGLNALIARMVVAFEVYRLGWCFLTEGASIDITHNGSKININKIIKINTQAVKILII
jgi:hypothetical protein